MMQTQSIKETIARELHAPIRKNFERRPVETRSYDDLWQSDLIDIKNLSRQNRGYKYILVAIDTYSKFAFCRPLKNKDGRSVTQAMKSIFESSGRHPKLMQTDKGTEYFNQNFQALMEKYNIRHYNTHSPLKASIAERFNRTLKGKLYLQFSINGSNKWVNILQDVVKSYNSTVHRTIKMRPIDVTPTTRINFPYQIVKLGKKKKFKIGDHVRISKAKSIFDKSYNINWTPEIFQIYRAQNTSPTTYLIKDYYGRPIAGSFYEQDLLKVKYKDHYLIAKTLKKKGDKIRVKWLGHEGADWINKNNVE